MALKKKAETPIEETVVEKESVITQEEVEAIKKEEERKESEGADTQRLRLATNVVSEKFNLDHTYRVCKFDDKGKVVKLTLENKDFIVDVTIKDSERQGMCIED